jgi:Ca2+/H+ antiporter, TMEM165/GDT1 family
VDGVVVSIFVAFGVVFVAELGDKSQLIVLAFAARYRVWLVLAGIAAAASAVHLASVAIGYGLGAMLPAGWISLAGAVAFAAFGIWTLRSDPLSAADEQVTAGRPARSVVIAVATVIFLAELGDKTMLATIALAADNGWFGTWVGSTLGMVAADALAIAVGHLLGRGLPRRAIRYGAAALFVTFGAALGVQAVMQLT